MAIRNREDLASTPARELVLDCIENGIAAADPATATRQALATDGRTLAIGERSIHLAGIDRIVIVGGGKAAGGMARTAVEILRDADALPTQGAGSGDLLDAGCVVVPEPTDVPGIETVVGSHPLPDEGGSRGASRILELARGADDRTLVIGLFSGGGSALLPAPAGSITLEDLRSTTRALVESGADIDTINAVRKHCSAIKGGRLAAAASPATVASLLISDVVGDDPAVVASGPTAPDASTFADAQAAIERLEISVPDAVRSHLSAGAAGHHPETPGPGDPWFTGVTNHVVAGNERSVVAAGSVAADRGWKTNILTTRLRGSAREAAGDLVTAAEAVAAGRGPLEAPAVLLAGGEPTVRVTGDGSGGPNQALCLWAAMALSSERVTLAAVDTDGLDGGSDAAGALVDADTVTDEQAKAAARDALDQDDAGSFLAEKGALLDTGPTGTNVNDLVVVAIEKQENGAT